MEEGEDEEDTVEEEVEAALREEFPPEDEQDPDSGSEESEEEATERLETKIRVSLDADYHELSVVTVQRHHLINSHRVLVFEEGGREQ